MRKYGRKEDKKIYDLVYKLGRERERESFYAFTYKEEVEGHVSQFRVLGLLHYENMARAHHADDVCVL